MLRSVKDLHGYTIRATDGDIGKIDDFYFDDATWTVRYLVVDTSDWLAGQKVLLPPTALGQLDWDAHLLRVKLTKAQVKNSPKVDMDEPISRQAEIELHQYYQLPIYWGSGEGFDSKSVGLPPESLEKALTTAKTGEKHAAQKKIKESHLRSAKAVIDYPIQARDGEMGRVEDFIVDDKDWPIRYIVVAPYDRLTDKQVLVPSQWIEQVNWFDSNVHIDLLEKSIESAPAAEILDKISR